MINATSNLVSAIANSLSNSQHGWFVKTFTSQHIHLGESSYEVNDITLKANNLTASANSNAPFTFVYRYVSTGETYSNAVIYINGSHYSTTNASLHSTINALANTYVNSKQTETIDILNTGLIVNTIPNTVLSPLLASFSNNIGRWSIQNHTQMSHQNYDMTTTTTITVSAVSSKYRINKQQAFFTYQAWLDTDGTLEDARINLSGINWKLGNLDFHANVLSLSNTFQANVTNTIIGVLT